MNGLLDFVKTPEGQGLLSGIFGYAANARRGQPINSLGRGGIAGLLGYSNAMEREQQAKDNAFQQEYRALQMDQLRQQAEQQKRQQAWRTQLPALMQPKLQGTDAVTNQIAAENAEFGDFGVQKLADLRTPLNISYGPDQNALQAHLMSPDSPFADKMLERQLFPKEAEAFTLGEGQVRYDGQGRVVAQGPEKKEATPAEIRGYQLAQSQGFTGSFFDYQAALKRAGASSQTVINKQEGAEAKTVGEFFGGSYADIQKAGMNASSKLNRYDRLGSLLEGVSTGKFTPFGVEVAKTAESLGIKIDPSLPNKEAAQALSGEIALELRNPSGGAGMPGAMSDADRQFLVSMVPGLTTTPQGRKLMLDTARKLAQRDQDVARLAREYRTRNGSIDEGFYNMLSAWSAQNPLFPQSSVMRANPNAPSAPKAAGARFLGFEQ